ncbi:MAG: hydantoinase/oxoprolinase family protein [Nitrospinota bacterium]
METIIGIDVGGTFTDLVGVDPETRGLKILKVFSTPDDQARGLLHGIENLGIPINAIGMMVHGSTVATNAVVERKGARVGLLTTLGFRDVIEIRRRDRHHDYGLTGEFIPLVPRHLRLEVDERMDHKGSVLKPVNPEEVERLGKRLLGEGCEAVVVSFLHCYANPINERRAKEVLLSFWPNDYIELSSEVLPEFREFERTSTTVVNAYVRPLISRYLRSVRDQLREDGFDKEIVMIQSNGGGMSLEAAERYSVNTVLSGPAAGAIAAAYIAQSAGHNRVISADMGGTSFDACLILDGRPTVSADRYLEFGVPVRISMIDIRTIGAGGGSVAWIDPGGLLEIGPQSAGAVPGPVCYDRGGTESTVTDANLLLGRINPEYSIAKEEGFVLNVQKARRAIEEKIAGPLDLGVEEAAEAIFQVANIKMANALRVVSIEKGYDPREFVQVSFGGAGPLHAAALARELGIAHTLIPFLPGVTSAMGCVLADMRHDWVQTLNAELDSIRIEEIHRIFEDHVRRGEEVLEGARSSITHTVPLFEADMQFAGQTHTVRVPLSSGRPRGEEFRETFLREYTGRYGDVLVDTALMVVNLRTAVIGVRPKIDLKSLLDASGGDPFKGERRVFFRKAWYDCPTYERRRLPVGFRSEGPAVIEQADATVFVEPETDWSVDDFGNLILEVR